MPHHAQHSLIHVLLLWTTILSIIQIVFIIFFFTAGHHGTSQNNSAVTPASTRQIQANNTPSTPFSDGILLGKGRMLTYEAEVGKNITWVAKSSEKSPVSIKGNVLKIIKDGYYFVILQVTLTSCKESNQKVTLKWNNKVLLQGQIIRQTCSTGLLGKVEEMPAGGTLEVSIDPPSEDVDTADFATHLDIIYIHKP